jgi:uroporphyrinogen-III synthase
LPWSARWGRAPAYKFANQTRHDLVGYNRQLKGTDIDLTCNLQGRGILVTRAAHQASGLVALIDSHGGRAIRFPALEILAARDSIGATAQLRLPWDLMVFISPNAVRHATKLLAGAAPDTRHLAAVGEATAGALREVGLPPDLVPPDRQDSEGLLALPELQSMEGSRVLIVRGEGGRPLLGDSLRARGAKVGYAEVYRRMRPTGDPIPLLQSWRDEVDIVTTTSNEVLTNLVTMLGETGGELLRKTPLLVISERMASRAAELGFRRIIKSDGADDATVMQALCDWIDTTAH